MTTIQDLIVRWDSGDDKPYKGSLIDWTAYEANPDSIACYCAQGQVLHLVGGLSAEKLAQTSQDHADRETAKLLGISRAHAILLRIVNDSVDGAPSIVLTDPAKVIGDQAETVLAFWRHLDTMTEEPAGRDDPVAILNAWHTAMRAAGDAARRVAGRAAEVVMSATCGNGADAAPYATYEIMGAPEMRRAGHPFTFLPMFGFADPEAVLAGDAK